MPLCHPWNPRAPQLQFQLQFHLQHRSRLWREGSVHLSVPIGSRGGLRPTTPHHRRSARCRCPPGRAWPWAVCCRSGGLGGALGGGAGPGGRGGDAPAGWGCARGACPACGPAGDAPWAAASACRWRAHARASSGTAGAWPRCWPWVPAGSGPPAPAALPPPGLGAGGKLVRVFWGSPSPRGAGAAARGTAPPPPCRSRGAARSHSTPGAPQPHSQGHRLSRLHPLGPEVAQHRQPLCSGLGGTALSPGDRPQRHNPCTPPLQSGPQGWGAGRGSGWLCWGV